MKKVIVRLANGLGNQLFTYAAAYSFSKKNNLDLYIDNESGFYKRHKYELHNFNLSTPIAEKKYKFLGIAGRIKRKLLINTSKFQKKKKFIIENKDQNKLTSFQPEQFNISFNDTLYIEGYFQSEKYYKWSLQDLLNEFSFKKIIMNQNEENIKRIKESNSVSIHLRQNKFLKDEGHRDLKKLNLEFINNNLSLIKKGIKFFDSKLDNPQYFLWSNNFSNVKSLLPTERITFMDENKNKDPAYDLYLMSLCKHFILSPSSMHYWAALLSKNKEKICLSPTKIKNISGYYGFSNNEDIKPDWWQEI